MPATVVRQVFLGNSRDYMVEVADGTQLRVVAPAEQSIAPGERGLAPSAAGALPGTGGGGEETEQERRKPCRRSYPGATS